MAEWLILLLLVPAIVVPGVLLVGFAGCDVAFDLKKVGKLSPPLFISAVGRSGSVITLTWAHDDPGGVYKFQFERFNPDPNNPTNPDPDNPSTLFDRPAPPAPFDDSGLHPALTYCYRVRAFRSDSTSDRYMSDWSVVLPGTTLPFAPTFTQTLTGDGINWQGFTLVQRIEPGRLFRSGTRVLMTVHASSTREAYIDRIYISRAASPDYQPAGLTAVYDNPASPLVVPKNTPETPTRRCWAGQL